MKISRSRSRRRPIALVVALVLTLAACGSDGGSSGDGRETLTLVTHDSFAVSEDVLDAFSRRHGIDVEILPAGDAGAALNQAILTKDDPLGDVFFGVDNTFLSRAIDAEIFVRYASPALAQVPDRYELDAGHRLTPVDRGDVCVNYDKAQFAERGLPVPETIADLADPRYENLLVVENPATSSPGLAFVLATIAELGEDGWRDYWSDLRANGAKVVSGWEQAYNGEFSAGEGQGDRPLVVSYASSPPAAVYFSDPQPDVSPVGTLLATCFTQIEHVGILQGTEHERAARRLVDFMLTEQFQEDIPLSMFVFPVRDGAELPPVFVEHAQIPSDPLTVPPARIGEHRERWIDEWTDTVLR